ncbi:MAG: hypothetical protein A2174_00365 [Candidatus Portnoybacteria bacterium RBG_13_41_18]|uniref:Uncharacterized protein n=1 Tax=Candidatus Portnoybacteria bacterium RBG_13_41_18 TaxID=1801991 RepID=A0A1G2F5M4_9BACT|nr:MAG: hypothetical protein A2174_00365 [Candidatus Portnoybacteria bacterium RBG_13_41_18]
MILPKVKKISLLVLLVLVSFVLSAVKFFSGGAKSSQAQAQCWTPPIPPEDPPAWTCSEASCGSAGSDCSCDY